MRGEYSLLRNQLEGYLLNCPFGASRAKGLFFVVNLATEPRDRIKEKNKL